MNADEKKLWQRESKRREALWTLESIRPGSEAAVPLLNELDEIDRQDLKDPLGDAYLISLNELREAVPETQFEGCDGHSFVIVLDHHIPQPWRARFEAASMLSTRLPQGSYASDWRGFLRIWAREMEHLNAHRNGRADSLPSVGTLG